MFFKNYLDIFEKSLKKSVNFFYLFNKILFSIQAYSNSKVLMVKLLLSNYYAPYN